MTENTIKTVKIQKIISECDGVKTIIFNVSNVETPKPGQFVMIWVPGVDEVPMSISGYDENGNWSITVKNIGECTDAIHNLAIGDYIGVRGPLGNFFTLPEDKSKKIFLIGGGIGIAPLKPFVSNLSMMKFRYYIIEGAKIGSDLIFMDEFQTYDKKYSEIFFCTDDGSYGLEGLTTETFENMIKDYSQEQLSNIIAYACGPEKMLYNLFLICEKYKIELFVSLERVMRCGCGLCGLCAIDPLGLLVCKDGPVFSSENLRIMNDFGKNKRDFTGKKTTLE